MLSVGVRGVEGGQAVAGVEVSSSDRTGTPSFVIDLRLVEACGGGWKPEEVVRAREGECGTSGCVVDGPEASPERYTVPGYGSGPTCRKEAGRPCEPI